MPRKPTLLGGGTQCAQLSNFLAPLTAWLTAKYGTEGSRMARATANQVTAGGNSATVAHRVGRALVAPATPAASAAPATPATPAAPATILSPTPCRVCYRLCVFYILSLQAKI
jgi:hypothetical protein